VSERGFAVVDGTGVAEMLSTAGGSCPRVVKAEWLDNSPERQATAFAVIAACVEVPEAVDAEALFTHLWLVLDAVREGGAVVVLYEHDGETSARVAFPFDVRVTKDGNLSTTCYCTKAQTVRSLRLDRMRAAHAFSTPDDAVPQQRVA
jgi:predicted DNA-binding transcriptional regulator YafY